MTGDADGPPGARRAFGGRGHSTRLVRYFSGLAPTWRLKVGSGMSGEITDVSIARCEFVGTDRGLRIKTRRGRGGPVARVAMRDVAVRGVATPLAVNAFCFCDPDGKSAPVQSRQPAPVDETTPRIEDVEVERVTADGVRLAAAAILGLPEAPVRASGSRRSASPTTPRPRPMSR